MNDETKKLFSEFMGRFAKFLSGESDICPNCESKIEDANKFGRYVYVYPCGCRVGQVELPKRWQE